MEYRRQQLDLFNSATQLRWIVNQGFSIRAYEVFKPRGNPFCVSTVSSELTYVLEGELQLEMGPFQQQTIIREGEGCMVLRGTPHLCRPTPGSKFVIVDIGQFIPSSLGIIQLRSDAITPEIMKMLPQVWETPEADHQTFTLQNKESLSRLSSERIFPVEYAHNTRRMLDIKRYLECHYTEPLRLQDLTHLYSCDRFYILRNFKKNFGISPSKYIEFLRQNHFLWSVLLYGQAPNLTELALSAGFNDYATFWRSMRSTFGTSPSQLCK